MVIARPCLQAAIGSWRPGPCPDARPAPRAATGRPIVFFAPWRSFLVLALAWLGVAAAPTLAAQETPRPSFDCKAARSVAEQLICSDPEAARMDAQAAALFAQARSQAKDVAGLRTQQLAWLRERDQACVAGASLAQAKGGQKARACLIDAYHRRIFELRDQAAAPLMPAGLVTVPRKAWAQTGLARKGCSPVQGLWDERGDTLALEVNCEPAGAGRRVWLIERGAQVAPATPDLGPGDPNAEAVFASGTGLHWDADTLYTFTSMAGKQAQPGGADVAWEQRFFAATMAQGPTPVAKVPERIRKLFDGRLGRFPGDDPQPFIADPDWASGSAWLLGVRPQPGKGGPKAAQATRAVWLRALPDDRYALLAKSLDKGGAATEITRGGPELGATRVSNWSIVYPSRDGLLVHDLETGFAQRVAGTSGADMPLAWGQAATARKLAWFSARPCGGAKGADGPYLCLAEIGGGRQPGGEK